MAPQAIAGEGERMDGEEKIGWCGERENGWGGRDWMVRRERMDGAEETGWWRGREWRRKR